MQGVDDNADEYEMVRQWASVPTKQQEQRLG